MSQSPKPRDFDIYRRVLALLEGRCETRYEPVAKKEKNE